MEKIEKMVGKKVKEAREKADLSQFDLAKATKTSITTINRLEKGHQLPRFDTLYEICQKLGIPLLGEATESPAEEKSKLLVTLFAALPALDNSQLSDIGDQITRFLSSKSASRGNKVR